MLIFGLGLTESHWKVIFQSIQKPLADQKVKARLLSQSEIQPQSIISTCEEISKSPPALFLLTPQGFNAFTDCLFFLSQLQMRIAAKQTQYGLILENLENDLYPFITYHPRVTLVNKMRFTVSDPSLLLKKAIRRFPRIRINSSAVRLEYQGLNNTMVNQSLDEMPINQLIALNRIQTVYTDQGPQSLQTWLSGFLQQQGKFETFSQIKGILKEKQGCYLFPGIPVDRIKTMNLGDIQVHFILSYQQLSQRSVSFKRMIQDLKNYHPRPPSSNRLSQSTLITLRCLGKVRIINQFVEHFLAGEAIDNIRFINHLPPGRHTLEDSLVWLQLSPFDDVILEGKYLDLHQSIQKILQPLVFFIDVNQLKILPHFSKEPISRIEWEEQRDHIMKQEKQLTNESRQAHNKYLLFSQEEEVLKDATQIAQRLIRYLAQSLLWEEVMAKKHPLEESQVLFFCEEQDQAYELNRQMSHIPKKLWINPGDYQDADQLRHLNIEMIQQYAQHGAIVITTGATKYWESLNNQIFERYHHITRESVLQKQVMEQAQVELELIQQKKEELALQWIYISLERLLGKHQAKLFKPSRSSPKNKS